MDTVYLDNNATTRPLDDVAAAVAEANAALWANPSSVHRFGQMVRQRVELARQSVASLIGARPRDLLFTSGGTESNNLAVNGLLGPEDTLITTGIEHAAVREPAEAFGAAGGRVVWLPLGDGGLLDPAAVGGALADVEGLALVSVMWANNETGVIQPIAEVASVVEAARRDHASGSRRVWFHTDATQAVGKLPVDVDVAGVDLLTMAAHKLHGPKGVGALWVRSGGGGGGRGGRGVRLRPVIRGGPQEREKRGGTENVPGILGFGVAAEAAAAFVTDAAAVLRCEALRDRLEAKVLEELPETVVNGRGVPRLWNTSNLGFRGLEAEAILLGLSERGVCASAGAACSSGSLEPSPVLRAMGVDEPVAHGSVRLSLSRFTTEAEVDAAVEAVLAVVQRLRRVMPVGV